MNTNINSYSISEQTCHKRYKKVINQYEQQSCQTIENQTIRKKKKSHQQWIQGESQCEFQSNEYSDIQYLEDECSSQKKLKVINNDNEFNPDLIFKKLTIIHSESILNKINLQQLDDPINSNMKRAMNITQDISTHDIPIKELNFSKNKFFSNQNYQGKEELRNQSGQNNWNIEDQKSLLETNYNNELEKKVASSNNQFNKQELNRNQQGQIEPIKIFESPSLITLLGMSKIKYSLFEELQQIIKNKLEFSEMKLNQILLQLLDRLIEKQFNQVSHSDIQLQNIIVSDYGFYLCASSPIIYEYNWPNNTNNNSHLETLDKFDGTVLKNDIYSLGKVFEEIIKVYKQVNEKLSADLVQSIEEIINQCMIRDEIKYRENCKTVHERMISLLLNNQYVEFLRKYDSDILGYILMFEDQYEEKKINCSLNLVLYYLRIQQKISIILEKSDTLQREKNIRCATLLLYLKQNY